MKPCSFVFVEEFEWHLIRVCVLQMHLYAQGFTKNIFTNALSSASVLYDEA